MNILIFSWRDPKHPLAGGAEQVMHEHAKGWIKKGHKVTLFASRINNLSQSEELDAVQIVRGGYQYLGVQLAGFFFYLKNKDNFDVVVDQFHGLSFLTPIYVKKPRLAVIQESAREVWLKNPLPFPVNWLVGIVGYLSEPLIFLQYKNTPFMTGSASAKKDLAKYGIPEKNIKVVPHGVIAKRPKPMPKKEKRKTVMFLGILSKDKGIEDALRCFSLLDKKGDFKFWVVGKAETDTYFKKIKKLTEKLGLKGKVRFWGYVNQEKKFELLARAHLLINSSIREGWGLVNIEANVMATPVIAYESAGLVDSVKDGVSGILVKRGSPKALFDKVLNVLKDEKKYNSLQEGAISWSKNFNWEKSRKISLNLLKEIVDGKK